MPVRKTRATTPSRLTQSDYNRLDQQDLEELTEDLLEMIFSKPEPTEEEMSEQDDRFDHLHSWSIEVTEAAEALAWKRKLLGKGGG